MMAWPPRYDPAWLPAPDAEHWAPELECAKPAERDAVILSKLTAQVRWAWERSPFYRQRWEAAGVSPATLQTLADLRKFPVVQKADLGKILALLPALQRPTISSLSEGEWVAVNTIIEERTVRDLIPRVKAAGGQGIVEYPLNKIVV